MIIGMACTCGCDRCLRAVNKAEYDKLEPKIKEWLEIHKKCMEENEQVYHPYSGTKEQRVSENDPVL